MKKIATYSIAIEPGQTVSQLQFQFNQLFPYLKIEFFSEPHEAGKIISKNKMIGPAKRIGELSSDVAQLEIDPDASVSAFEKLMEVSYGLYVQVFRKSGNIWLQTSATDNWTLVQQNDEGKSLQQHFSPEKENPDEHDIY